MWLEMGKKWNIKNQLESCFNDESQKIQPQPEKKHAFFLSEK